MDDDVILSRLQEVVEEYHEDLLNSSVRRLTFVIGEGVGTYPKYFTFRGSDYAEDKTIRHIEPALAFQLELGRLSNFNIKPILLTTETSTFMRLLPRTHPLTGDSLPVV